MNRIASLLLALAALLLVAGQAAAQTRAAGQSPQALYHNYCSVCHGDRGDGRSRATGSLFPPPRSFVDPNAAETLTRQRMIDSVRDGRPGTAMTGWKTQLDERQIEAVVDYILAAFMKPALSPSVRRGKTVYEANCAACHGIHGQGGAAAGVAARDFRTPQAAQELTRARMLDAVVRGKPGTAMAGFAGRLPLPDMEAAVDYVASVLMMPATPGISGVHAHGAGGASPAAPGYPRGLKGNAAKGRSFYVANCAACHGERGDGEGPRAYFIRPRPRNFTSSAARAALTPPALFEAVANGRVGTEMPAWNKVLTDQQIADVAEYVHQAFVAARAK